MRTEKEMMALILNTAQQDERIRAVIMNGSRTNPQAKKDCFQDYDVVYIVRDIASFTANHSWVDRFGPRVMMQMPEDKVMPPAEGDGHFIYLMQFMDGNRLDLTLLPVEKMAQLLKPDSLSILLLDKDGIIGSLPPSSDKDYHVKKPSEREYQDVCNEFWWICMNISKGLWREELTYVMFMYEQVNRNVLLQMLEWKIGIETDFSKSVGKHSKYMKDFLDQEEWEEFVSTYPSPDYESIWQGLFNMCDLFRKTALDVADRLGFAYPYEDDQHVTAYLQDVYKLPKDAREIDRRT